MVLKGRASVIQAAQMSPPESRARAGFFSMDPTLEGSGCGSSHFIPSKRVTKFSQVMGLPMVRELRRVQWRKTIVSVPFVSKAICGCSLFCRMSSGKALLGSWRSSSQAVPSHVARRTARC